MTVEDNISPDTRDYIHDHLHALGNCVELKRLELIREQDEAEDWRADGASSMEAWLAYRYGFSHEAASKDVQIAHSLARLPAVAKAFEDGLLTKEKLAILCSFVEPEEDEKWAKDAPGWCVTYLHRCRRYARRMTRAEAAEKDEDRAFYMYWDDDLLRFYGHLPGADGARFKKAIERLASKFGKDVDGSFVPFRQRNADALVELASTRLGQDPDKDRATVVVHIDASELEKVDGVATLEDGVVVHSEVARRLACDGYIQTVVEGADGKPIGVGRRQRTVPPWMTRLLRHRDERCVCCGLPTHFGTDSHHLVPWADGGGTDLENLALVCWRCHKALHERGFSAERDADGQTYLVRPNGCRVPKGPTTLRPDIRERFLGPPSNTPGIDRGRTSLRC